MDYRDWGPAQLCDYVRDRAGLHGRVVTSDELEVAGIFVANGSLKPLVDAPGDLVILGPNESRVFEDIWNYRQGGSEVDFRPYQTPDFKDRRQELRKTVEHWQSVGLLEERPRRKVGRNELCPCGSGRKYKRCCGSPR